MSKNDSTAQKQDFVSLADEESARDDPFSIGSSIESEKFSTYDNANALANQNVDHL
jgi:hypothetical protein